MVRDDAERRQPPDALRARGVRARLPDPRGRHGGAVPHDLVLVAGPRTGRALGRPGVRDRVAGRARRALRQGPCMAALRILITGASSFTGCWFARGLAAAGHDVTATFRQREYEGLRADRMRLVCEVARPLWETALGDVTGDWDVICAHGAEATEYRSPDFDADAAVAEN